MSIPAMLLILHNNAVYCLAVVVIFSALVKRRLGWYLLALALTTAAGITLTVGGKSYLTMPVTICLLALLFAPGQREPLVILSRCLTAVFLTWCFITPFSCIIMIIAPEWHDGPGCNLLSGAVILLYAALLRCVPSLSRRLQAMRLDRYIVTLELLVLSFFTLILPQYFPVFAVGSKRQIGLFTLSFFILLVFVGVVIHRMQTAERQRRELRVHMEQQQHLRQQTQRQFDTVIALRHYYSKLYYGMVPLVRDGDMDGLKAYFEQYITPIHWEHLHGRELLMNIQNVLIKNLLDVTISQVDSLEGIALELTVEGIIQFSDTLEMDVFEILCNLLDNAMRELEGQSSGLLRIILQCDGRVISVTIANSLRMQADIEKFYKPKLNGSSQHGYGLSRVRDIVCRHPELEQSTYTKGMYEGKKILVQQIRFRLERK